MSVRFQHRVQLFPGVRLNFSSGSLSVTLGVPGASVNVGQRGSTLNLGIPGTGLSYRQRLGGPSQPLEVPEHSFPRKPGFSDYVPKPNLEPLAPGATEIRSATVERLTSEDLAGLKRLLSEASSTRERLTQEATAAVTARAEAWRAYQRSAKFPLSLVSKRRLPGLQAAFEAAEERLSETVARLDGCRVAVDFAFDEAALAAWNALVAAHATLSRCSVVWDVTSEAAVDRVKTRSSASRAIQRRSVRLSRGGAPVVASRWAGLRIGNANGEDLEIFPGFCLMRQRGGSDFALLDLRELELQVWRQRFVENERVPPDAVVVDTTWSKVNKNGERDRRFADNRQIPIMAYGQLAFRSRTGLHEEYMASSAEAAVAFGVAFAGVQHALDDLARRSQAGEVAGAPAWDGGAAESETPPFAVPPLPEVSGAHGYTAAVAGTIAAAAVATVFWTAPLSRPELPPAGEPSAVVAPAAPFPHAPPSTAVAPLRATATAPIAPGGSPVDATERVTVRSAANVRASANGDAAVIRTASAGSTLRVHGRSGGWVRVGDAQPWGWIHGSLLGPAP